MMTKLERYLKAATRGLWGQKKLEVIEELESHVLERAHKHELLGLAREDAISKSMQELGNARVINRKITEVYMPSKHLLLGTVVAGLLGVATWQATTLKNLKFACVSSDQTTQLEAHVSTSWLKAFSTARDLEGIDFLKFQAQSINTVMRNLPNDNSIQINGSNGWFSNQAVDGQKRTVQLANFKFTRKPEAKSTSLLRCGF
jgi:hypothetical protein